MKEELLPLLQRPPLWQRSAAPFWDDAHISRGMREAHLAPGTDAASRKHETIERSAAWMSQAIPAGARLLDLGCGPGLYTKRLAERGYRVTGMDVSRRSIAYAKAHDPASAYICQNYLELDAADEFDAIIMIYCDYAALTRAERGTLLAHVKRALRPGGLFVFDVFTEAHFAHKTERTAWHAAPTGGFWSAEPYVCLEATYLYENNTVSADRYAVVTDGGVADHIIWDTAYTERTLAGELAAAGLCVRDMLGDACGAPYATGSETLCCIAYRPRTGGEIQK